MNSAAPTFPAPRNDDDGDVHWALTTALALWAKGDGQEALKWLRRAADSASDANQDARSLELYKAAADVTNRLQSSAPVAVMERPPLTLGPGSLSPRTEVLSATQKSAPPPPPRGRAAGQAPRSMVEAMANTVPGPRLAAPQQAAPVTPPMRTPPAPPQLPKMPLGSSAPTRVSGVRSVATHAGKTLASSLTYEQAKDTAAEIRRAVAKTVQPDGPARPMPTAAKPSSDRTTHPGMGLAPLDVPPPSSRGKRRTTQTGRKHAGAVAAARAQMGDINRHAPPDAHRTPTVVFSAVQPPTDIAIHEAVPSDVSRTQRFEDEGTVEKEPTLVGVSFPDLDEQTNVLTGKEANVQLFAESPPDENGSIDVSLDGSVDSATDPGASVSENGEADTRQTALPRGLLSAFRVAVLNSEDRLELLPLVPGEPTPAGAVGCMLVATDVQSSVALADLIGKRVHATHQRKSKP